MTLMYRIPRQLKSKPKVIAPTSFGRGPKLEITASRSLEFIAFNDWTMILLEADDMRRAGKKEEYLRMVRVAIGVRDKIISEWVRRPIVRR